MDNLHAGLSISVERVFNVDGTGLRSILASPDAGSHHEHHEHHERAGEGRHLSCALQPACELGLLSVPVPVCLCGLSYTSQVNVGKSEEGAIESRLLCDMWYVVCGM